MKGIRFYLEYPNGKSKRKATRKKIGNHSGTVLAVLSDNAYIDYRHTGLLKCPDYNCQGYKTPFGEDKIHCPFCNALLAPQKIAILVHDAIGALQNIPDSVVCGTGVSADYLAERCKHISENLARRIHPQLFSYLDDD